ICRGINDPVCLKRYASSEEFTGSASWNSKSATWCATRWSSGLSAHTKSTGTNSKMRSISLRNHQRARSINSSFVRLVTRHLLHSILDLTNYELTIHFISAESMAGMNQRYLQHEGSTDVITFDYRHGYDEMNGAENIDLSGEIFISVADALRQ